jgi:hypothetical protein
LRTYGKGTYVPGNGHKLLAGDFSHFFVSPGGTTNVKKIINPQTLEPFLINALDPSDRKPAGDLNVLISDPLAWSRMRAGKGGIDG